MQLELKNIKYSERASYETPNYVADLYVDGKKIAYVHNEGRGGETFVQVTKKEFVEQMQEVKKYCESLPKKHFEEYGGFDVDSTLCVVVDGLLEEWIINKELKKYMNKGIIYGTPESFGTIKFGNYKISDLLKDPNGISAIKKAIEGLKARGEKVLNTNIPNDIM